jgi:hypothetical protein
MRKIVILTPSTLLFLAITFIFSQTCFSAPVVDSTKCMQCHTLKASQNFTGLHNHSWASGNCLSCHTNAPGDTVTSARCIVCHPAGDPGKQQLIDSHFFTLGADCLACHTSSDVDEDGIPDANDNCPSICNSDQLDADGDGVGDVCDTVPGCGGCGQPDCEESCGGGGCGG